MNTYHKNEPTSFINLLVRDLKPVVRFEPLRALIVSVLLTLAWTLIVMLLANRLSQVGFPLYDRPLLWTGKIFSLNFVACVALLLLTVLSTPKILTRIHQWLIFVVVIASILVLISEALIPLQGVGMHKRPFCLFEACVITFGSGCIFFTKFSKGYSLLPKARSFLCVAAGGLVGIISMDYNCLVSANHSVAAHAVPACIAALVAYLFCQWWDSRLFRRSKSKFMSQ